MSMNPPNAAVVTASQRSVHASLFEEPLYTTSSEEASPLAQGSNHSVPVETYHSTDGVCNELARFAMNRSAVMQAYDSMFPRSGVIPTARQRAPLHEPSRPGWVQRTLGLLRGRARS